MATQKQIAANRANSKRSTGPKTAAGKLRSSRNAFRHGLSLTLPYDPLIGSVADAVARTSITDPDQEAITAATEMVHAQFELLQIRRVRREMMIAMEIDATCVDKLQRLAALDRYERLAQTKRLRASRKLKL